MRAMVFTGVRRPLVRVERPIPEPGDGQLLLWVAACGICRTDLHLLDGEVTIDAPPRVLGHQMVGTVVGSDRHVGVRWLGWTCEACVYCLSGRENHRALRMCGDAQRLGLYELLWHGRNDPLRGQPDARHRVPIRERAAQP
jgi:D-arabinose 1-dehydrogenase-like Zn-dependent alcohol dehydrogenase